MLPILFFILTGICAAFTQALFFREFLAVFQGNELVIGFLLTHTVFAFSLGIFLTSKVKQIKNFQIFPVIAAILLALSFAFVMNIRGILNIGLGGGVSLKSVFIYVFVAVFPVFFTYGILVFSGIKAYKNVLRARLSVVMLLSGMITGGLLFYSFMYSFSGTVIVLATITVLLAAAMVSSDTENKIKAFFFFALIPVFCGLFLDTGKMNKVILANNFDSAEIVECEYTAYGQTVLTQKNNEYALLVNNIIQFSWPDNDILNSEDFGHIPVLYPEQPDNVLIIGGAAKYLPMILSHEVRTVDYLEPDAAVVEIVKNNISHLGYAFNDGRVNIYNEDARTFLSKEGIKYNLILVGFPAPVNLNLNSFYTREFFQTAKKRMKKNGFVAVKLPGTMAFSTFIMAELNKSVMDAMQSVFQYANIIPGSQNILIAADRRMPYRMHIKKRLYKMQETTLVLSKYYLDDRMDTERTRWLKNELNKVTDDELMNTDLNPHAMLLSVLHAQSAFSPYLSLALDKARKYSYLIFFVVVLLFFMSKSIYKTTSFVSGATSMWIFITVLFAVQILNGELYRQFGMLFALFISGAVSGLVYSFRSTNSVPLNKKMFYSETLFLLIIIFLLSVFKLHSMNMYIVYAFLIITGFTAGTEFLHLLKISELFSEKRTNKVKIYIAAAAGILFSALAGGCFLIAAWGMEKALIFILFMKFLIFCRWADLRKRGL